MTRCALIARRRVRWRLAGLAATLFVSVVPGPTGAYLFFSDGRAENPVPSESALRWSRDDWGAGQTLLWEIAPDPDFDVYYDSPEGVIPYVQRGLEAWSSIPTADVLWEVSGVSEEGVADPHGQEGPRIDGRNTVFIDSENWAGGYAAVWMIGLEPSECDFALSGWAAGIPEWVEPDELEDHRETERESAVFVIVHELGHCLGLGHAGDLSIAGRWNRGWIHPRDPAMAYGYTPESVDDLAVDDIIGASLLRPVRRWALTAGRISGVVTIEDEPAPYAHVWALPAGKRSLQDRVGVFTDADGMFLIEGLDPGDYALWAQPIGDQTSNPWVTERGGPTDLDDTILGSLVRVRTGRTTEDVAISMRGGRAPRPPPERTPPRIERGSRTPEVLRETVCSGVRIEVERPYPADGPLWLSRREFSLARDRWLGTTLVVEWHEEARNVMFDWAGSYRNWSWRPGEEEGDAEHPWFFPVWEEGVDQSEQGGAHTAVLDVSIADYRIEQAGRIVRHTMDIAWPESTEATLRFRSEDNACDGEPLVVCHLGGCEIRREG